MSVPGTLPTTALVFVAGLFPVPFADTLLQNAVRRRFVRQVSDRYGLELTEPEIRTLAEAPLAPATRVVLYGVKKVLGRLLWPLAAFGAVRQVRGTWGLGHRALALRALEMPAAPG